MTKPQRLKPPGVVELLCDRLGYKLLQFACVENSTAHSILIAYSFTDIKITGTLKGASLG